VNLALLLATLAVLAGVGELAVRRLAMPSDRVEREGRLKYRFNPYRPDGVLGHSLRSDWETVHATQDFQVTVRTNSLGLRGAPVSVAKPPGVLRLLVLGDSFAFGFGVEDHEAFPALLAPLLAERLGRRVEVLNAGVPGWSADHYYLFMRTRGFALEPDAVLVAVTENDVDDLGWNRLDLDEHGLPLRIESTRRLIDHRGRMRYVQGGPLVVPDPPIPGKDWLSDHSALYHWLRFRFVRGYLDFAMRKETRRRERGAGPPSAGPIESLAPQEIQSGLARHSDFRLRYHRYLLAALERDCRARGVPTAYLLVAFHDSDPQPDTAVAALHDDCEARTVPCLDTGKLPDMNTAPDTFYPHDGHWRPAAHRRVAEAVAAWLAGLELAGRPPAQSPS
jgi:lysophospholipase L1-like esterase